EDTFCKSGNLSSSRNFLLLCGRSKHGILRSFRHSEFKNGLRGYFDLLARCWIPANTGLSFLLYKLAKAGKRELTLLRFTICEISERRHKVFDLFLADTGLVGHLSEDLGLGHLCHQNPPLRSCLPELPSEIFR